MKNKGPYIILSIIAFVVIVALTYNTIKIIKNTQTTEIVVKNFQSCVDAGNPVMESYPRQCSHEGKSYIEVIQDNKERRYFSHDVEQCKVIRYMCVKDSAAFSDETGCGCEGTFTEPEEPENNYCSPEGRNVEVCTAIYQPVCGWNDPEKIQCIRYPCAQDYTNSCDACANENVLYWTEGKCPA